MKPFHRIENPYKKKKQHVGRRNVPTTAASSPVTGAPAAAGIKRPVSQLQISTVTPDHRATRNIAGAQEYPRHYASNPPQQQQQQSPSCRRNLLRALDSVAGDPSKEKCIYSDSSPAVPQPLRPGWCLARCSRGDSGCPCVRARIPSRCAACGHSVEVGQCIHRQSGSSGWAHVRCQRNGDGVGDCDTPFRSLYKKFRPLSQEEQRLQHPSLLEDPATVTPMASQCEDSSSKCRRSNHDELVIAHCSYEQGQQQTRRESTSFGLTEEQQVILAYRPKRGELIRIKARAGTGKTTTVAFLCHELLRRNPHQRILYVIFSAHGALDAKASGKFPQNKNVTIMTSHAYALQCLALQRLSSPKRGNYSKQNVARLLQLQDWVNQTFGLLGSVRRLRQRAITIAGYVIQTLNNFQQSDDVCVREKHVFWRATLRGISEKSEWRSKIPKSQYVRWARTVFDKVWQFLQDYAQDYRTRLPTHVEITHDGYFKAFQLERLRARVGMQCDVVIVDESQDMNACQACVLWGLATRMNNQPTVYMVGDDRQRLFRFRGASQHFETSSPNVEFNLTGSFRFGQVIGKLATMVLQQDENSRDSVRGLAQHNGAVLSEEKFHRGVVICRTNNGIYDYLQEARPKRWALFSTDTASPLSYLNDLNRLQSFMTGTSKIYTFDGEEFQSFEELKDFCGETHQQDMLNKIAMIEKHQAENTDINGLFGDLCSSFVRDWRSQCQSIDDFDGIVLLTCHKAKGLEFNNVLVYDDFRFDEIMKLDRLCILANSYSREMLDLVYVAVTRTKEKLYLCKEGLKYIGWLEKQRFNNDPSANDNEISTCPLMEGASPADLRDHMEKSWRNFAEASSDIDSIDQIPAPLGPNENPFCFDSSMTRTEQLKICKSALLRYHPDKFFQLFSDRLKLSPAGMEKLKSKLHDVTDQAYSFWKSLRE